MSWFDVIKNQDDSDWGEKEELDLYEEMLKIKSMLENAREDLYTNIEPAVKGLMNVGLDEKQARETANVFIAPMLKDVEIREKDIDDKIKELSDAQKR
tara:strand:- start:328 stop:621 length:294 start_codon:yes stop_codon:yes gene_type:complete